MKKVLVFIFPILLLLVLVSSINLEIKKTVVNDVVISELNKPATFSFQIRNLGSFDNFEIYSLISGINIYPIGTFSINGAETKNIEVNVYLDERLRKRTGILTFTYKIRGQSSGIQDDTLTVNVASLEEAVSIGTNNIFPESAQATVYVDNKVNTAFPQVKAEFDSAFFSLDKEFSLSALEKKEFNVSIDREKIKKLVAGQYILTGDFEIENIKKELEGTIKFVEKSGISTKEEGSGIIFRKKEIEKTNEGNLPVTAEITLSKDIISRLFTTFNIEPDKSDRKTLTVQYTWTKELRPSDSLRVIVSTNYLYPLLMLVIILAIAYFIYMYKISHIILRKKVSFVKTKGGEFALKVTLTASSRKFIEKISVIDRLPAIANLYERFGAYPPDRIDDKNKRLEWNIESLQPGEARVFSYIIYSRINVVGKFELPAATAVYEKEGKIHEISSNKAFFMNEPQKGFEFKGG